VRRLRFDASGAGRQCEPVAPVRRAPPASLLQGSVPVGPKRVQLVFLFLALFAGCARQLPLALPPDAPVEVFEVGGSHYTLEPSSEGYRALARWVSNNRSGWSWWHYYTTPPAKGVIVRCGTLELRFFDTTVLDRTPQGDYLKTVRPSEYAFLRRNAQGT
jgi:hypothetical protein